MCATEITADFDATEARCPGCKTVHRVDALIEKLRNDLEFEAMTARSDSTQEMRVERIAGELATQA
jgi:hypothetical protein